MARTPGSDQRRHVRYELIDFALLEADSVKDPIRCVIVDVSLGGLQIRSKTALPVGEKCSLRIARLGKKPIRIQGEVRHSGGMKGADLVASGFRFLPDDQDERVEIMEYVHSVFVRRSELVAS
jgi:c-di-GMP-binding flagellar brake protein YcgR